MRRSYVIGVCRAVLVAALLLPATALGGPPPNGVTQYIESAGVRPLLTGVVDDEATSDPNAPIAFRRIDALGAHLVRIDVNWGTVAPGGATKPAGFDAQDPEDPAYHWDAVDREVTAAVAAGLDPMLTVYGAPQWAAPTRHDRPQDGPTQPDPTAYGDFATALAHRYSGDAAGLPRVRYWQAWNEPNVSIYLMPQYVGTKAVAATWYRGLVNAFSDAVHAVDRTNVTIMGGLSPFSVKNPAVETVGPMAFLRQLFCLSAGRTPHATCATAVHVDAVAIHPYTSGDPAHSAENPNDVSLGDLAAFQSLVKSAVRLHHLVPTHPYQTWITEFGWDSKPSDPKGVPMRLEARWVSEMLYRAWSNGISRVFWFKLRDEPFKTSDFQSGLYTRGATLAADKPKLIASAFRFPFVAYAGTIRTRFWGRTPASKAGAVRIQLNAAGGWRTLTTVHAAANGIFQGTVRLGARRGSMRAVVGHDTSLGFSLIRPADYPASPFGST